jgi:hypothetical protein
VRSAVCSQCWQHSTAPAQPYSVRQGAHSCAQLSPYDAVTYQALARWLWKQHSFLFRGLPSILDPPKLQKNAADTTAIGQRKPSCGWSTILDSHLLAFVCLNQLQSALILSRSASSPDCTSTARLRPLCIAILLCLHTCYNVYSSEIRS